MENFVSKTQNLNGKNCNKFCPAKQQQKHWSLEFHENITFYDLLNLGQDSRLRYQFDNNFWWRFLWIRTNVKGDSRLWL